MTCAQKARCKSHFTVCKDAKMFRARMSTGIWRSGSSPLRWQHGCRHPSTWHVPPLQSVICIIRPTHLHTQLCNFSVYSSTRNSCCIFFVPITLLLASSKVSVHTYCYVYMHLFRRSRGTAAVPSGRFSSGYVLFSLLDWFDFSSTGYLTSWSKQRTQSVL